MNAGFWAERLEVNNHQAIFHQWEQLESSGCIQNFRLAAGEAEGFREGWFFADSDAYKWLEAAARIWVLTRSPHLEALMEAFIDLLSRVQMPDGYLFTYNQLHFPGVRWKNLQIEHELYCHGHLIEAGVSHYQATGRTNLLEIAHRAADRIVADFQGKGPAFTPGHEEIEIALLRLHSVTPGNGAYLDLARQFIEQRGRLPGFSLAMLRQNLSSLNRAKRIQRARQSYQARQTGTSHFQVPSGNPAKRSLNTTLRWLVSALKGEYNQQHVPVEKQVVPVGHSVRFAYLETAIAMLARLTGDPTLLPVMEKAWQRLVNRRMYLTGGIGSLPGLEGFGRDDELDPELAYAETCAALGCLFWNREMAELTGGAKYADLLEWQLYNAVLVGMGRDGCTYLFNNPLANQGSIDRRDWYSVPCCPSNLSRTLADLGGYIYSQDPGSLTIHQYISSELSPGSLSTPPGNGSSLSLKMDSSLPWSGKVCLVMNGAPASPLRLHLRQPGWTERMLVSINTVPVLLSQGRGAASAEIPASGFDPTRSVFQTVQYAWAEGDVIELDFDLPITLRRAPTRVMGYRGKVAVTRGPLVYCLESVDHPDMDIFTVRLDPDSLTLVDRPDLLGGILTIEGKAMDGSSLTFIPYFLWGNRGPSKMTVWVHE